MKGWVLRVRSVLSFAVWLLSNVMRERAGDSSAARRNWRVSRWKEVVVSHTDARKNISRYDQHRGCSRTDPNQRRSQNVGELPALTPGVDFRGSDHEKSDHHSGHSADLPAAALPAWAPTT